VWRLHTFARNARLRERITRKALVEIAPNNRRNLVQSHSPTNVPASLETTALTFEMLLSSSPRTITGMFALFKTIMKGASMTDLKSFRIVTWLSWQDANLHVI